MDYSLFKFIHLLSVVFSIVVMAHLYLGNSSKKKLKHGIVLFFSFALLISGLFLMGDIGINFYETWPFWVKIKMVLWISIFGMGLIIEPKVRYFRSTILYFFTLLLGVAIILSVYHPPNLKKLENAILSPIAVYTFFR